jgi:hypothetical protein
VVKNSSMKKIIIILILIVLFVVAYKYYKYFEHSLVVGNPVFNENIDEAKKNKSFIYSYLQSDNYENIFDEVWLEKKAYISKKGIEKKDENLLKFSFANKIDTNLKVLDSNFKLVGFGFTNNVFIIETNYKDLVEKDTLKISVLYNNKRINKTFLRMK